jgi:hypothetical protein
MLLVALVGVSFETSRLKVCFEVAIYNSLLLDEKGAMHILKKFT